MQHANTRGMGEAREAEKETETFFGNNSGQSVPNLMENIEPHIQEAQLRLQAGNTHKYSHTDSSQ